MATPGEMSHLLGLQGAARERFAKILARREERDEICAGCGKTFTSTRQRARFCSPECCVAHFAAKPDEVTPEPEPVAAPRQLASTRRCEQCGREFASKRIDARLCSARCRKASSRAQPAMEAQKHVTDNGSGYPTQKVLSPAVPTSVQAQEAFQIKSGGDASVAEGRAA